MAITTLDGIITGLIPESFFTKAYTQNVAVGGQFCSMWYTAGHPAAAAANSSGLAGAALTGPLTGALIYPNPAAGNSYLSNWSYMRGKNNNIGSGMQMLVDRLWHNSGLDRTLTTAQTVNSAAWPARDSNGSTNGEGVYVGIEISTTMGTGVPAISMSYTNSAGSSGRTATAVAAIVASSPASTFIPLTLDAGDTGVRSIQSITFSVSWGAAGVLHLVAYRPIAMLPTEYVGWSDKSVFADALTLGMPRIFDSSVLQIVPITGGAVPPSSPAGVIGITQG